MGEEVGLLSGDGLDEMEAISGQSSEGEIGLIVFVRFGESSEAESIGDNKGIDLVGLLFIGVSPFEVSDEFGVELIDGGVERSKLLALGQKVHQVEIEEGGGFCGDL